MGGGRQCLQSNVNGSDADPIDTWSCYSKDGRDLIEDWKTEKYNRDVSYQFLSNNEELENADVNKEFTLGEKNVAYLHNEHIYFKLKTMVSNPEVAQLKHYLHHYYRYMDFIVLI